MVRCASTSSGFVPSAVSPVMRFSPTSSAADLPCAGIDSACANASGITACASADTFNGCLTPACCSTLSAGTLTSAAGIFSTTGAVSVFSTARSCAVDAGSSAVRRRTAPDSADCKRDSSPVAPSVTRGSPESAKRKFRLFCPSSGICCRRFCTAVCSFVSPSCSAVNS